MKSFKNRFTPLLIVCAIMLSFCVSASAHTDDEVKAALDDTAKCMYEIVKKPAPGSIGGEWVVLGLSRCGFDVPEKYYQDYYATVEAYVAARKGVLHKKKYTEYSRMVIGLSAIGKDARDVGGYNLLTPLGDYDKTIWQGLNGPIWALIALDSMNYPMPENPEAETQATRQMYIDCILSRQLSDGGWSLTGGTEYATAGDSISDPDITGMALQALAKYQDQPAVAKATQEALDCMSKRQDASGGFDSWGTSNSESCVQMIVALCELGIPLDDERFVKNGKTMVDNLLTFYIPGKGFMHTKDSGSMNQMATEQAFYGLTDIYRVSSGMPSLYRMSDVKAIADSDEKVVVEEIGLPGKHEDVKTPGVSDAERSFSDIAGHANQAAIEALASRDIINGMGGDSFAPDETMTRAQFATIVVKALGLEFLAFEEGQKPFNDVPENQWYYFYVHTASTYGIVKGVGSGNFNPAGTITRQDAAVMVARAAKLCGMDTEFDEATSRDILAQFGDYVQSDKYARSPLAFCYNENILDQSELDIRPKAPILRCEIAQMLYNMLGKAKLL